MACHVSTSTDLIYSVTLHADFGGGDDDDEGEAEEAADDSSQEHDCVRQQRAQRANRATVATVVGAARLDVTKLAVAAPTTTSNCR